MSECVEPYGPNDENGITWHIKNCIRINEMERHDNVDVDEHEQVLLCLSILLCPFFYLSE